MDYNNEEEYNDNNLWDETITSYNEEINQIPHNDEKEIPEYIVEKIHINFEYPISNACLKIYPNVKNKF